MKKFLSSIMICVMSITSTGTATCFAAEKPPESASICTTERNINSENEIKDLATEIVANPGETTNKKEVVKAKPSKFKKFIMQIGKDLVLLSYMVAMGYIMHGIKKDISALEKENDGLYSKVFELDVNVRHQVCTIMNKFPGTGTRADFSKWQCFLW